MVMLLIRYSRKEDERGWVDSSYTQTWGTVKSSRLKNGTMESGKSFVNVVKANNTIGFMDSHAIVLDDECVCSKDLSNSLMGRVKEFASITNLKIALLNEGFGDLTVKYLGELWVLFEFSSTKLMEAFRDNVGVNSWFSKIRQASLDINPDGVLCGLRWKEAFRDNVGVNSWFSNIRQASLDINPDGVEGVPLKLWSLNSFKRIASKWGDLIDVDDIEESCFHSKRLCLFTKCHTNIFETFKIIFHGKVYWIRAKEVPGWVPEMMEKSDDEEQSIDGSMEGDNNNNDENNVDDKSDTTKIRETVFDESCRQKENKSDDPFDLYPLLNKNTKGMMDKVKEVNSSPLYPLGFTPNNETNDNCGMGENSVKCNAEEEINVGGGGFDNAKSKEYGESHGESMSFGRFKRSEAPRMGGSFLGLMEEVVKVGQTMGYNMEGVETKMEKIDMFSIRRCWGGVWIKNGTDLIIIVVYAPHDSRDKRMLWDYLVHVVNQWHGEVVIMGDFNKVRYKSDRFGSNFNEHGVNAFNAFISNAGLEEIPLGGSAFTWCYRSATKMSKLDRFFVSNNLFSTCPHISAITLDRYLSDHRPILLREKAFDFGQILFRFFHHWFEIDDFRSFVSDTWNCAPVDSLNGMRNMAGKLKFLKINIRKWGARTEVIAQKRGEVLNNLHNIDQMHAMDLAQKAKIKWSIEGDENSSFFHGMLNKKHNQMSIRGIMVDGVWKEQPMDVKRECLLHFQTRSGKPVERRATIEMCYPRTLSSEQCNDIERMVSKKELNAAVWDCGMDKSPGPDGFTFGFYRQFWPIIKEDVYTAVSHFFNYCDIPNGCNSSFITLILKLSDA
nr:RNA-directed DNA polymerase, eukaryota [Tanacetum cinerariifolium]